MLQMGQSRPWMEAMEKMTGQKKMSTKALREYFEPLEMWLKKENKKSGAQVGWGKVNVDAVCKQAKKQVNSGQMGQSRPWMEAMEKMTGQKKMSTKALREYFEPLEVWLRNENKKSGVEVGWGSVDVEKVCRQAG